MTGQFLLDRGKNICRTISQQFDANFVFLKEALQIEREKKKKPSGFLKTKLGEANVFIKGKRSLERLSL